MQRFEDRPDTGFFGKNCARICNYIYYYVFVFLFFGVVCSLILYPLFLLTAVLVTLILLLTSPVWMALYIVLFYLFQVLIYDLDSSYGADCQVFRLIVYILIGVYKGPLQIVASLVAIAWLAFLSVFHLVFSLLRYILRTVYDSVTYCIICTCGRVPVTENWLAWRVSGPGIGQDFYYSMEKSDL